MKYKTYISVDVDVDISKFDDEVLLAEIETRGIGKESENHELITELWHLRRTGKNYEDVLDKLIYNAIGKII